VAYEVRGPLLVVALEGQYYFHEAQTAIDKAINSTDRRGLSLLIDARRSAANPSGEELAARAEWISQLVKNGDLSPRCATVVGDSLFRGLTRMLSSFLEWRGVEMRVFEEIETAVAWLLARQLAE